MVFALPRFLLCLLHVSANLRHCQGVHYTPESIMCNYMNTQYKKAVYSRPIMKLKTSFELMVTIQCILQHIVNKMLLRDCYLLSISASFK